MWLVRPSLMPAPPVLILAETFLADAVVVKNAERLEQRRLRAIVFLEAAHALSGGFFGQQLIVLTSRGHAALIGLAGYKHLRTPFLSHRSLCRRRPHCFQ